MNLLFVILLLTFFTVSAEPNTQGISNHQIFIRWEHKIWFDPFLEPIQRASVFFTIYLQATVLDIMIKQRVKTKMMECFLYKCPFNSIEGFLWQSQQRERKPGIFFDSVYVMIYIINQAKMFPAIECPFEKPVLSLSTKFCKTSLICEADTLDSIMTEWN